MTAKPRAQASQVTVASQLMQNYRVGSPLPAGAARGALATAVGKDGALQLFSIGTNGHVYNIYRDPSSETGWSSIDMGAAPDHQALEVVGGTDDDGVMFAATVDTTDYGPFYIDRIRDARWNSAWQTVYASEGYTVSKLRTGYGIGGCIENITNAWIENVWGPLQFRLEFPTLSPDVIVDWAIGTVSTGPCCMVCLNLPGSGAETFKVWTGPSFSTQGGYIIAVFSRIAVTPAPGGDGTSAVFLISADDNGIYYVTSDLSVNQEATTVKISGDVLVEELAASSDQDGLLEVFALGTDHYLYHVRQDPQQTSGWSTMVPINEEIQFGQLAVGRNSEGRSELFAVSSDNTLHHIWRDPATTDWVREEIEVGSTGQLEVIHSYTTEVTVLDAMGRTAPNTTVTVWSLDPTPALINGRSCWIDEAAPAICMSDPMGKVTVVVETATLDAPWLQFATEFMGDGEYISVQPNAAVQDKFSTLTAQDLLNPTNPQGEPVQILKPPFNTQQTAQAVADALNQCGMLLGKGGSAAAGASNYLASGSKRRGVAVASKADARSPREIDLSAVPDQHWEIDYSSGFPVFRQLTRESALTRIADVTGGLPDARDFLGLDVDLGDVLNMATQTVSGITDVIVTTVTQNGLVTDIQLAIELLVNGHKCKYDGSVNLVDQAFDLAQSIFAKVAAAIDGLFDWLENLFQWDEILLTKDALKFVVNDVFALSTACIQCVERNSNDFFDTLKLQARNSLDQVIAMNGIQGQTLQQIQAAAPPPPPELGPSISYNMVATAFYGSSPGSARVTSAALALSPEASTALQELIDLLVREAGQLQASEDYQRVLTYFRQMAANLETNPEAALQSALSGMLGMVSLVVQLALDVAKAIVSALLKALASVVAMFQDYLNASWDNEFLVGLYRYATNDPDATLSVLDLLCLMLAIPATALYKAVNNEQPPFPDTTSLTTFETAFGGQVARAIQALGPAAAAAIDADTLLGAGSTGASEPSFLSVLRNVVNLVSYVGYGGACMLADLQAFSEPGQEATEAEMVASVAAIITESVIWGLSCPYWTTGRYVPPGFATATQTGVSVWVYSALTIDIDVASFVSGRSTNTTLLGASKKKASLQGDAGTCVSVVEGALYCGLYGTLAYKEYSETNQLNVFATVANFFTALPYVLRIIRLQALATIPYIKAAITIFGFVEWGLYIGAGAMYWVANPAADARAPRLELQ